MAGLVEYEGARVGERREGRWDLGGLALVLFQNGGVREVEAWVSASSVFV